MSILPMKQPSAVLPPIMSVVAIGVLVLHLALFGIVHEADEGTAAHLWQLLMGGQLPIIAWFVARWVPATPRPALRMLAIQIAAAIPSLALVYLFT